MSRSEENPSPFCLNPDLTSDNNICVDPIPFYEKFWPVWTAPTAKIESGAIQKTEAVIEAAVPDRDQMLSPALRAILKEMIDQSVDEKLAALLMDREKDPV